MKLRNNENIISISIIAGVLLLVSILWMAFDSPMSPRQTGEYKIVREWELPKALEEVSGITWIAPNLLACVQDEDGIIFVYNLEKRKIDRKIDFAGGGDYEGIALVDDTMYILRSDGKLFEVQNYLQDNPVVKTHSTPFSERNNMECLTFDKERHRLLLAPKDMDLSEKEKIGIYAFDLKKKKLDPHPILYLSYSDEIFRKEKKDNEFYSFNPADIAIHPKTNAMYIIDGKNRQLLLLDSQGTPTDLIKLAKTDFNQPEGIIFSPAGKLYISNEGKKMGANILEVALGE